MTEIEKATKYQAPALEKGLDILEYLSLKAMPLSQTEIATGISRKSNEIFRMLVCLEARGYIIREEISGKYKLSLKIYNLSHRHSPVDDIRTAAQYPMYELAGVLKQSCHLSVLYHSQLMVIHQSKSPSPISLSIEEGSLFPLVLTASGKVFLSFMSEEEQNNVLKSNDVFKKYSKLQQKELTESLSKIKETGYYIEASNLSKGVTDIVVPIGNMETGIVAVLAVSMLTTEYNEGLSLEDIIMEVQSCAGKILQRIGF
ncbi:IclR family transcriptional regulator [Rufibacter tibetensis]|uniref:IclR family transcriptional regulator n=1 Tax=Rufibacter tibetensis TaxID=512763 RepID=A0A0P0CDH7_9BACT|nr:IclR family transcriptional regulator [Rufibacter tibetensis]ALJ01743.1 IclR family transcriptional regulator [Rufibacter tibetensis]